MGNAALKHAQQKITDFSEDALYKQQKHTNTLMLSTEARCVRIEHFRTSRSHPSRSAQRTPLLLDSLMLCGNTSYHTYLLQQRDGRVTTRLYIGARVGSPHDRTGDNDCKCCDGRETTTRKKRKEILMRSVKQYPGYRNKRP